MFSFFHLAIRASFNIILGLTQTCLLFCLCFLASRRAGKAIAATKGIK